MQAQLWRLLATALASAMTLGLAVRQGSVPFFTLRTKFPFKPFEVHISHGLGLVYGPNLMAHLVLEVTDAYAMGNLHS